MLTAAVPAHSETRRSPRGDLGCGDIEPWRLCSDCRRRSIHTHLGDDGRAGAEAAIAHRSRRSSFWKRSASANSRRYWTRTRPSFAQNRLRQEPWSMEPARRKSTRPQMPARRRLGPSRTVNVSQRPSIAPWRTATQVQRRRGIPSSRSTARRRPHTSCASSRRLQLPIWGTPCSSSRTTARSRCWRSLPSGCKRCAATRSLIDNDSVDECCWRLALFTSSCAFTTRRSSPIKHCAPNFLLSVALSTMQFRPRR